jgi:ADP-ribosylglycohydrolase
LVRLRQFKSHWRRLRSASDNPEIGASIRLQFAVEVAEQMTKRGANQERFLGTLLGMAIGDALGMPVAGWSGNRIRERFGRVDGYHRRVFPDGADIKAGEFTDESEVVLCIVESITTNQGNLDADNIGARLSYLARGESKRWMGADTLAALRRADDSLVYQVPLDEDGPATGDVAARGIAVGLVHAIGPLREEELRGDAELVTRLTHGSPLAIAATTAVAFAVQLAARGETPPAEWAAKTAGFLGGEVSERLGEAASLFADGRSLADAIERFGDGAGAAQVVATAVYAAMSAPTFEDAVFAAVNAGGATDSRGAIAGALAGGARGAGGIPQPLIDELEGRIYVSLAAPWLYRTALSRSASVIDLRPE